LDGSSPFYTTTTFVIIVLAVIVVGLASTLFITRGSRKRALSPPTQTTPGLLGQALRRVWGSGLDQSTWDRLEEELLSADVGVEPASRIIAGVRSETPTTVEEAREALAAGILSEFGDRDRALHLDGRPAVILVIGVNGSGKTTTIAKLGRRLLTEGRSVVLAAADTFRAAAGEQLAVWGERLGVPVISGREGGDPASVVHDALTSARSRGADTLIVDTAGRLHSRKNLMEELAKIHRVAGGDQGVDEVLLVLDATGGQNALAQVREFASAIPVTGVVMAKLDGTAKGGILIAVETQLGVPVKLVGTGEGPDDLTVFEPRSFVASLLGE
jgi:fused signal recognition particle receptor